MNLKPREEWDPLDRMLSSAFGGADLCEDCDLPGPAGESIWREPADGPLHLHGPEVRRFEELGREFAAAAAAAADKVIASALMAALPPKESP